jgi:hypothetical protein
MTSKLYLPGLSDGEYSRCRNAFEKGKSLVTENPMRRELSNLVDVFDSNPIGALLLAAEFGAEYTTLYKRLSAHAEKPAIVHTGEYSAVQWDKSPRVFRRLNPMRHYGAALARFREQADSSSLHLTDAQGRAIPPTHEDNVRARVEAFHSGDNSLYKTWFDSSTHFAYDGTKPRVKIANKSSQLMDISPNFTGARLPYPFDDADGEIFDLNAEGVFNTHIKTKQAYIDNPALAYLVQDKALREADADIVINNFKLSPRVWTQTNAQEDHIREVFANYADDYCGVDGSNNLSIDNIAFLRVAQP